MPNVTYYAEFSQDASGYTGKVVGMEIKAYGKTFGNCRERLQTDLTMYIELLKGVKPIPEPAQSEAALPLEIRIINRALVVQRHDISNMFIQGLLSELDFEPRITNNLADAIRYMEQEGYDAIISGSMYNIKALDEEVDDTAWEKLHKEVHERYPESNFILFTSMLDIDPSKYNNPTVHFISRGDPDVKERFRQALQ